MMYMKSYFLILLTNYYASSEVGGGFRNVDDILEENQRLHDIIDDEIAELKRSWNGEMVILTERIIIYQPIRGL